MTYPKRMRPAGKAGHRGTTGVRSGRPKDSTSRREKTLTPRQRRAIAAFYGSPNPRAVLTAEGLAIAGKNGGKHWIVSGHGLRLNHWPSTQKWMAFGKVWQSSAEAVIRAITQGRITMPADAQQANCKRCNAMIWWLKSDRGRWLPVEADGDAHISRCGGQS